MKLSVIFNVVVSFIFCVCLQTDGGVVNSAEVGVVNRSDTTSLSESVDLDGVTMDGDLRSRLKRIAQEINARSIGYKERRPPPVSVWVGVVSVSVSVCGCC